MSQLFSGVLFFVPLSTKRAKWKSLIEAHGGILLDKPKSGCIVAVTAGMGSTQSALQGLSGVRVVKGEYIEECVSMKEVLDTTPFLMFEAAATPSKKRHLFTHADDDAIIRFVLAQKRIRKIALSGSSLWQTAEAEKITKHTWQSMRERWRKHLSSSSLFAKALQESGLAEHRRSRRIVPEKEGVDTMEAEEDQRKEKEIEGETEKEKMKEKDDKIVTKMNEKGKTKPKEKKKRRGKQSGSGSTGPARGVDGGEMEMEMEMDGTVASPEEEGVVDPVEEVLEFVKFAVEAAGVTEAVAYHALYACSGNSQDALDYMLGQEGNIHPWTPSDDRNIALAFNRVVRQRGLTHTESRKSWLSS